MNFLAKLGIGIGVIVGIGIVAVVIAFCISIVRYVRNDKQFEYEE